MEADIVVVGGGPAGSAVALTLSRYTAWRVCVVDRGAADGRVVGESIGPGVLAQLRYLGVDDELLNGGHLRSWSTAAAWGTPEVIARDTIFTTYGAGWQLDRARFDAALLQQAEAAGAWVRRGLSVTNVARTARDQLPWTLQARDADGSTTSLRCRFLVDATGRGGTLARRLGGRCERADRLAAVVGFLSECPDDGAGVFVESVADGWWYTAPVPGGRMVAAFFSDADLLRSAQLTERGTWQNALRTARRTRERCGDRLVDGALVVRPAQTRWCVQGGAGWVAAGDAAAAFDPLSGMGVGFALHTGIHAARVADQELRGGVGLRSAYEAGLVQTVNACRARARSLYAVEARWPDRAFWRRRQRVV